MKLVCNLLLIYIHDLTYIPHTLITTTDYLFLWTSVYSSSIVCGDIGGASASSCDVLSFGFCWTAVYNSSTVCSGIGGASFSLPATLLAWLLCTTLLMADSLHVSSDLYHSDWFLYPLQMHYFDGMLAPFLPFAFVSSSVCFCWWLYRLLLQDCALSFILWLFCVNTTVTALLICEKMFIFSVSFLRMNSVWPVDGLSWIWSQTS